MATLPQPLFAGNAVTTTVTFTIPPSTTPVDPSTVTLKYKAGSAAVVTWVYLGAGSITKSSVGVYAAELDTTALQGGWTVEWIGTGTCAGIAVSMFLVEPLPI